MDKLIKTAHIALQYRDKKEADTFFCSILGLNKEREFTIPADTSNSIFSVDKEVDVIIYSNKNAMFEIFFTQKKPKIVYDHICLNVKSKKEILNLCRKHRIEVNKIKMGKKTLLFIRDFSGYLYEIKEMNRKVQS